MLERLGRTLGNFIHCPVNRAAFTITGNGAGGEFLYQRLQVIVITIIMMIMQTPLGEGDFFALPC